MLHHFRFRVCCLNAHRECYGMIPHRRPRQCLTQGSDAAGQSQPRAFLLVHHNYKYAPKTHVPHWSAVLCVLATRSNPCHAASTVGHHGVLHSVHQHHCERVSQCSALQPSPWIQRVDDWAGVSASGTVLHCTNPPPTHDSCAAQPLAC